MWTTPIQTAYAEGHNQHESHCLAPLQESLKS
jgi:hypothetical protein